jgi:RNA polymerase sigma-70 factor (ECF subfamily)
LAIDRLRSAKVRRESYVGTWLPEPLVAEVEQDPSHHAEMDDSLSMAFLVLLERLSPIERAVFLLCEVFQFGYHDIPVIVGKSEVHCRQVLAPALTARARLAGPSVPCRGPEWRRRRARAAVGR